MPKKDNTILIGSKVLSVYFILLQIQRTFSAFKKLLIKYI